MDIPQRLEDLRRDGFAVFANAVPKRQCEAVLEAIASVCRVDVDDPTTWKNISTEIDQVPLWNHQALWDIRQLPLLYDIWSRIWGRSDLWTDLNSCRVTPPIGRGGAQPLPIHLDVDPRDTSVRWFPGIVALTDARAEEGGFCCAPSMIDDSSTWPDQWPTSKYGVEYRPDTTGHETIEVPLQQGDLLIFDSRLPHGTVPNTGSEPRAVFYVQQHPAGTEPERRARVADLEAGLCPPWWRWKPGHDQPQTCDPVLTELGSRLYGKATWTSLPG